MSVSCFQRCFHDTNKGWTRVKTRFFIFPPEPTGKGRKYGVVFEAFRLDKSFCQTTTPFAKDLHFCLLRTVPALLPTLEIALTRLACFHTTLDSPKMMIFFLNSSPWPDPNSPVFTCSLKDKKIDFGVLQPSQNAKIFLSCFLSFHHATFLNFISIFQEQMPTRQIRF